MKAVGITPALIPERLNVSGHVGFGDFRGRHKAKGYRNRLLQLIAKRTINFFIMKVSRLNYLKVIRKTLFFLSILVFPLFCLFVLGATARLSLERWGIIWRYRMVFWHGWLETLLISLAALILSSLFALIITAARRSSLVLLRLLALCFIEVIRGTPLLAQMLFFFYIIGHGFGFENRFLSGILILSFFSSAYISEMLRAGIEAVPLSQWESAKVIGLTQFQIYRYVIFPQALRSVLPGLTGQFASLIKDSSLLSIIGINEFALAAQQVNAVTYCTLESFFPLTIGYLLLTFPLSLATRWMEKKLNS